jgi:hypothetical protein
VKNDLENIDELFKEAFDGFEADVDPSVWNNIQGSIGSSAVSTSAVSTSVASKSIALKFVAGILVLGSLATGIYLFSVATTPHESEIAVAVPKAIIAMDTEKGSVAKTHEIETVDEVVVVEDVPVEESKAIPKEEVREEIPAKTISVEQQQVKESKVEETKILNKETVVVSSEKENNSKKQVVNKNRVEQQAVVHAADVENEEIQEVNWEEDALLEREKHSASIDKDKIPRRFSPNGDGIGDVISVKGRNIKEFHAKILNISNAKVIFEWFWIEGFWNGRDMFGNKVPEGTYMLQVVASGEDGVPIIVNQSLTVY